MKFLRSLVLGISIAAMAPLAFAARVTDIAPPSPVARDANNDATLTITCKPQVRPAQRAALGLDAGVQPGAAAPLGRVVSSELPS